MQTRRNIFAALAVAPVVIAAPRIAHAAIGAPDPVDAYLAAFKAYDEDDAASVDRFMRAGDDLTDWEPGNLRDTLRKIVAMFDEQGTQPETQMDRLTRQAHKLLNDAR